MFFFKFEKIMIFFYHQKNHFTFLYESLPSQVLCAMLEFDIVASEDYKMQIVTTLQSTGTGKRKYANLCDEQIALRDLV